MDLYFITIRISGAAKRYEFKGLETATDRFRREATYYSEHAMYAQVSVRVTLESETRSLKTIYINSEL